MADPQIATVSVPITQSDKDRIADALAVCPFPQDTLLKLALRIGLEMIKKDPSVLMPYLAKKS
jgi:hypothetical protein